MKALILSLFLVNVAQAANLPKEYLYPGTYANLTSAPKKKAKSLKSKTSKPLKSKVKKTEPIIEEEGDVIVLRLTSNQPRMDWLHSSPEAYIMAEQYVRKNNSELTNVERDQIVNSIFSTAQKYKLDPKLMLGIIAVESNFDPESISSTGDYSIAQINYNVWRKELPRVYNERLSLQRLRTDIPYSIDIMGKILSYIRKHHASRDRLWFARYHSTTRRYKNAYAGRVKRNIPKGNVELAFAD